MGMGSLSVVSTPIGNLGDITVRAIETLKTVSLIAAEDTRRTGILLAHYGISTKMTSFNAHNSKQKCGYITDKMELGENIALVSDSGTPGVSDPGFVLISSCIKKDISITAVPGPTAAIAALTVSGKPANKFVFEGFLSSKRSRRKKQLEQLKDEERTVIIYEAPHRILGFLEDLKEVSGDREIAVIRELTKKYEEINRGRISQVISKIAEKGPRGEFTVVF